MCRFSGGGNIFLLSGAGTQFLGPEYVAIDDSLLTSSSVLSVKFWNSTFVGSSTSGDNCTGVHPFLPILFLDCSCGVYEAGEFSSMPMYSGNCLESRRQRIKERQFQWWWCRRDILTLQEYLPSECFLIRMQLAEELGTGVKKWSLAKYKWFLLSHVFMIAAPSFAVHLVPNPSFSLRHRRRCNHHQFALGAGYREYLRLFSFTLSNTPSLA